MGAYVAGDTIDTLKKNYCAHLERKERGFHELYG